MVLPRLTAWHCFTLQVWFIFSGNGSQWPKMGATLLTSNTTFRDSINACAAVLKPLGIDLLAEFQADKGWKTPLLASVGLIAVQIGLVDILRDDYGVVADGMLGHSAGTLDTPPPPSHSPPPSLHQC
jgi:fatty acid synthase